MLIKILLRHHYAVNGVAKSKKTASAKRWQDRVTTGTHALPTGGQIIPTALENHSQCLPELNHCLPWDPGIQICELNECVCLPEDADKNVYRNGLVTT